MFTALVRVTNLSSLHSMNEAKPMLIALERSIETSTTNETKDSLKDADDLRNIVEGNYIFTSFPFTTADFVEAGYTSTEANYYIHHLDEVPEDRH